MHRAIRKNSQHLSAKHANSLHQECKKTPPSTNSRSDSAVERNRSKSDQLTPAIPLVCGFDLRAVVPTDLCGFGRFFQKAAFRKDIALSKYRAQITRPSSYRRYRFWVGRPFPARALSPRTNSTSFCSSFVSGIQFSTSWRPFGWLLGPVGTRAPSRK